jgi:DDE superfamily endonuclease
MSRRAQSSAVDFAHLLKNLSDKHFPHTRKIKLVQDNLNTHKPASLYEAFPAAEARRLVERFEWHYTPKHGSWLNMAEAKCHSPNEESVLLATRSPASAALRNHTVASA